MRSVLQSEANAMFKLLQQISCSLEVLTLKMKSNLVAGKVPHGFTKVSLFLQSIYIVRMYRNLAKKIKAVVCNIGIKITQYEVKKSNLLSC